MNGFATYSTKKFPVSEYPAKLYVLKTILVSAASESGVMPPAPSILRQICYKILYLNPFHPGTGTKEELKALFLA